MTRIFRLLILASACGLSACTQVDGVITRGFASVNGLSLMSTFGGITAAPIPNSTTVQRVRAGGGNAGLDPLQPEEGNVWPPEEGPRATLANPDEALRGIPGYQPGTQANSPLPQRGESPARRPARGSDAALEQAEVILMHDRIENFLAAHRLSRRARAIIRQNLTVSLGVVVVMVTATALGTVPLAIGVAAHEGSTLVVCLNSLRLLFGRNTV